MKEVLVMEHWFKMHKKGILDNLKYLTGYADKNPYERLKGLVRIQELLSGKNQDIEYIDAQSPEYVNKQIEQLQDFKYGDIWSLLYVMRAFDIYASDPKLFKDINLGYVKHAELIKMSTQKLKSILKNYTRLCKIVGIPVIPIVPTSTSGLIKEIKKYNKNVDELIKHMVDTILNNTKL